MSIRTVTSYFRGFMRDVTSTMTAPADYWHPADFDVEYGEIEVDEGSIGDAEDYLREIAERCFSCGHDRMTDDACDECGESCSRRDVGAEDDGVCHDDECPIHGVGLDEATIQRILAGGVIPRELRGIINSEWAF